MVYLLMFLLGVAIGYTVRRYWSERNTVNPYWPKKYIGIVTREGEKPWP